MAGRGVNPFPSMLPQGWDVLLRESGRDLTWSDEGLLGLTLQGKCDVRPAAEQGAGTTLEKSYKHCSEQFKTLHLIRVRIIES